MICLTEDCTPKEFLIIRETINESLDRLLPEKCSFEK